MKEGPETDTYSPLPSRIKKFTPESHQNLENLGYLIYTLTGQSILNLQEAGRKFWTNWGNNHQFEIVCSRLSEVAINPNRLFLPQSNNKAYYQQDSMVKVFSQRLAKKFFRVRAIIGEAADYAELTYLHLDTTHDGLFGDKYGCDYTRTKTFTVGSLGVIVGDFGSDRGLGVERCAIDEGASTLWVAPLIIPV